MYVILRKMVINFRFFFLNLNLILDFSSSFRFDLEAYVSFHMSVYQLTTLGVSNHKTIMVSIKEDPWD